MVGTATDAFTAPCLLSSFWACAPLEGFALQMPDFSEFEQCYIRPDGSPDWRIRQGQESTRDDGSSAEKYRELACKSILPGALAMLKQGLALPNNIRATMREHVNHDPADCAYGVAQDIINRIGNPF